MKNIHFMYPELLQGLHPITINLIGAGGTGSHVITQLAKIHYTLTQLGSKGIYVTSYDPDIVEIHNVGRQNFLPSEIGSNKAVTLTNKINRAYGLEWKAIPFKYEEPHASGANLTITCVDTIKSRKQVEKILLSQSQKEASLPYRNIYWLDCGNERNIGQIILGSLIQINQPSKSQYNVINKLKTVFEFAPELKRRRKESNTPSCSMAEALTKQDLFINSLVAQHVGKMVFDFIRNSYITNHAVFLNLDSTRISALSV